MIFQTLLMLYRLGLQPPISLPMHRPACQSPRRLKKVAHWQTKSQRVMKLLSPQFKTAFYNLTHEERRHFGLGINQQLRRRLQAA